MIEAKGQSLVEQLIAHNPEGHVVFTAIRELKDPGEMRRFMFEFAQYVADNFDDESARRNPMQTAGQEIGYILGYAGSETKQAWFDAVEGLEHPIFGRTVASSPEQAVERGMQDAQAKFK
ncbi:MAG: hypothetical protein AAB512_02745 [Patescibacteria group bacterium]